jgi:hypothetical protein
MTNNWLIGAEIVFTFLVVVGFCLWQLRTLSRLRAERDRKAGEKSNGAR